MSGGLAGFAAIEICVAGTRGAASQEAAFRGIMWMGLLCACLILGAIILTLIRNRMRRVGDRSEPGFSLEQLRQLRDQGRVSIAEYERLKKKLVEQYRETTEGGR